MATSEADKAKMQRARLLIQEKRYVEARAILVSVDDPRATDWIMRIDAMPPVKKQRPKTPTHVWIFLIVLLVALVLGVIYVRQEFDRGYATVRTHTSNQELTMRATLSR